MDNISHIATVTALCNVVGGILKQIPKFPDWAIPAALALGIGPGAHIAIAGMNAENIIEGVLAGAAAVGLHQGYRGIAKGVKE